MDLAVALVGGLVGGTVAAIIGGIVTLQVQTRQHEHDRSMAREQRLQDRRARAYERALEHAYRLQTWAERTEPFIGPKPEVPPPLPDEELWKLGALTAAHASPGALALTRAMSDAARRFNGAALRIQNERQTGIYDASEPMAWPAMEEARQAFYVSVGALADRINAELRGDA